MFLVALGYIFCLLQIEYPNIEDLVKAHTHSWYERVVTNTLLTSTNTLLTSELFVYDMTTPFFW